MTVITRRAAMAGIAATASATAALAVPAACAATSEAEAVLAAWRAWRALEEEKRAIDSAWQDIHDRYPKTRQIPSILVFDVQCVSDEGIDKACGRAPAWMQSTMPQMRESAKRELAAEIARSEELEERIGLTRLQLRSDEVDQLQEPHLELIENAGGSSPVIVAAKLDCALAHMHSKLDLTVRGPSSIASAIRGLLPELPEDMREKLAPIAAMEGTIGDVYRQQVTEALS